MTTNRKAHVPFFLVVYGSPFVALFAVMMYVTVTGTVSFLSLLVDVGVIVGVYMGILAGYRTYQPQIQRWRLERAAKRQLGITPNGNR